MTAATKKHLPSSSKPPKNHHSTHNTTTTTTPQPNITQNANPTTNPSPLSPTLKDQVLSRATHITRQELLKRRSYKLKQLSKCFKDHYWALMEELKIQYREYYWEYGVSPFQEDHQNTLQKQEKQKQCGGIGVLERENEESGANIEVIGENNTNVSDLKSNHRCLFVGCKLKAMALTSFCHLHILSDAKQKLYKPCGYVIKSAQAGPITCGKPILRSTAPSLCTIHLQKAQKHVTQALRKAGLNVSSSSKLAPKFHVIVTEYVRQIQFKRKAAERGNRSKVMDKEVTAS
ncbi:PREDICTED: INO80 complex subunit D-like [Populus euphratica]|uniref:KAT8 regulatory NSL complex subunit 2 n=1 Tax=Populus euphratica TaxID=75702 RepID=A0AAJ6UVR8_POPEU|nr:PREDICTED: INO80 complex subunit D-like [Populus euphratica]XP_011037037.1 PREDICTED: INO80 complex subunit D-like [Populus euphratica]XP_011037038.1 PREDICTED: INO80 complex subunit D-like [Populus euphratica]XP_011037039.1 PREDICTED: INO80 complex subunit D-like [Populus euphratica]XP_011037040.1 PREDICTED: INO80 complex subunit D-like [Populus euphratica]